MLRISLFADRPECLLVLAPEPGPVSLPTMQSPFVRGEVSAAAAASGIDVRVVVEAACGRWAGAMRHRLSEERAERANVQQAAETYQAMILRGSVDPNERKRGVLLQKQQEINAELHRVKDQLGSAKSRAFTKGVYLPPQDYRRLEARARQLGQESQGIQVQLSELRKEQRQSNTERSNRFHHAFFRTAKERLDPETFNELLNSAEEAADNSDRSSLDP